MRTTTGRLGRAWIGGVATLLAGGPAMAVEFVDDPVSGTCKALVKHQGSTGVRGLTKSWPGLWGVTEPILYIGDKRTDEAGVTDGIDAELAQRVVPATRGRPASACVTVKNFSTRSAPRRGSPRRSGSTAASRTRTARRNGTACAA